MSWSDIRFFALIVALMFLFSGDPDVFDHLRDMAMQQGCVK